MDTTEVDPQYLEIVTIHGRDFQKYSINKSIHLVPVDEVNGHPKPWLRRAHQHGRKKYIGSRLKTDCSTSCLMDDSFFHQ